MTKEKASLDLDNVKLMIQICNDDMDRWIEESKRVQAIINKKDDWRDKLAQGEYIVVSSPKGLSVGDNWISRSREKAEHTFKEKEHAQLLADKMNLMQEVHAFAHVRNDGWLPDWADEEAKWGLAREFEHVISDYTFYHNEFVFGVSVKSEEIAQEMVEEFGERIQDIYNKQY